MPLIINELEVTVAPEAKPPAAAPGPGAAPPAAGMSPQRVLALLEGARLREERLRAH